MVDFHAPKPKYFSIAIRHFYFSLSCVTWSLYLTKLSELIFFSVLYILSINPLTTMTDHDRISPYNVSTMSSSQVRKKCQLGDYYLI